MSDDIRLTTHLASNLVTCRFESDVPIHDGGAVFYRQAQDVPADSLPKRLFDFGGILAIKIARNAVTITREVFEDWPAVTRPVAEMIREFVAAGRPLVPENTPSNVPSPQEIHKRAEEILEAQINPIVAGHGGSISLVEVKDATVFVRLSGGCQGCASSTATLRQGVERAFRDAIPELDEIVDVTDHAAGTNPYHAAAPH